MQVHFFVVDRDKRLSKWVAYRSKRRVVPGSVMPYGKGLPHDLMQYIVEAATSYEHGFWGLVEQGATFKSTGRRLTKPGRAIVAAHRAHLDEAEQLAGLHVAAWHAGHATPVATMLDAADAQWRALKTSERLVYSWPCARGEVVAVPVEP